jgi:glycosyltransferase involved in cell wall biosynthesis
MPAFGPSNEAVSVSAPSGATIALAHDYVTQRGGAERVALAMSRAFRDAPMYTTLYDPAGTFPEFAGVDVRPMPVNRWSVLRHHHRLALPFLADAVDHCQVDADVLLASSSGWAHGIRTTGRKIVYCHAPARWLYQSDRYAQGGSGNKSARARAVNAAVGLLGPRLREWDRRSAVSAQRYVVNSTVVQHAVSEIYGIEAEVLAPPPATLAAVGEARGVPGVELPFVLCVARLLPYKNVDAVIEAVGQIPGLDLVVVGDGPDRRRLEQLAAATPGTHVVGRVDDAQLRWLYENSSGLVAASFEDFGLSPVEAATFGKPTAALNAGGYLDTVVEGATGVFFDESHPDDIAVAVERMLFLGWDAGAIRTHAEGFSEARFAARLQSIVQEELARA